MSIPQWAPKDTVFLFAQNQSHCTIAFISKIEVIKQSTLSEILDFIDEHIRVFDLYAPFIRKVSYRAMSADELINLLTSYSSFCTEKYLELAATS